MIASKLEEDLRQIIDFITVFSLAYMVIILLVATYLIHDYRAGKRTWQNKQLTERDSVELDSTKELHLLGSTQDYL